MGYYGPRYGERLNVPFGYGIAEEEHDPIWSKHQEVAAQVSLGLRRRVLLGKSRNNDWLEV